MEERLQEQVDGLSFNSSTPDFLLEMDMYADVDVEALFPSTNVTADIEEKRDSIVMELNVADWAAILNWSEAHFLKQTQKTRVDRLTDYGIEVIEVEGRGKKLKAKVEIPNNFWYTFLVPGVRPDRFFYEYMKALHTYKDGMMFQGGAHIASFHREFAKELKEFVKDSSENKEDAAFERIKTVTKKLREYGCVKSGRDYAQKEKWRHKTHRIRRGDAWVQGIEAQRISDGIIRIWIEFYADIKHRGIDTSDTELMKELKQICVNDILRRFKATDYRLVYSRELSDSAIKNYYFIRHGLLEGKSITEIRAEVNRRQEAVREEYLAELEKRREKKQQEEEAIQKRIEEEGTALERFEIAREYKLSHVKDSERITEIYQEQKRRKHNE